MFGLKQDAGWAKSPMSGLLSPKVIFTTWQTPLLKPRYWNYKKSVCKIPCNIIAHWKFIWQYVQARGNDCIPCLHLHLHLSLNPEDRWGTTNDFTTTSSIFLCSPLDFANSRPVHSLMFSSPSSSVCLVFFPLSLCLARWFWPDLMNWRHVHTTAVCVFFGLIACWILERTSLLITWSLYEMCSILQWHLVSMACILHWSSAVRVHDSQAYWKRDVTREHISCVLELREMLLWFQTGFNLVNTAVVCTILESVSRLEPSSVITDPRYLKLVLVSSF